MASKRKNLTPLKDGIFEYMSGHENDIVETEKLISKILADPRYKEYNEADVFRALYGLCDSNKLFLTTGHDISFKQLW